jgi:hypothetical protein
MTRPVAVLVCALLAAPSSAQTPPAASAAARVSPNIVIPGELVIEPATLIYLWLIDLSPRRVRHHRVEDRRSWAGRATNIGGRPKRHERRRCRA